MKKYDPLFDVPPAVKVKKTKKVKISAVTKRFSPEERLDVNHAKTELKKAFDAFAKKSPKKFGNYSLKDYLPSTEEDPFLLEMTFKQLVSINLDYFLAKRSINNQKVENILIAFSKLGKVK